MVGYRQQVGPEAGWRRSGIVNRSAHSIATTMIQHNKAKYIALIPIPNLGVRNIRNLYPRWHDE